VGELLHTVTSQIAAHESLALRAVDAFRLLRAEASRLSNAMAVAELQRRTVRRPPGRPETSSRYVAIGRVATPAAPEASLDLNAEEYSD
jgi:hypothetical protein